MPVKKMNTYMSPFRRIEFPIFDGNQPRDWIRDCEEYFQTLSTSENHKVILALIYMQGRAKIWGQVYEENMINPTWSKFVAEILEEFDNFRPKVVSLERVSCQPLSENATVEGTGENVEPQVFDKMLELAALSKEDFETTKGDGEAIEIQVFDKMLGKQLKKVNVNHGRELMKGVTASMLDVHGGKSLEKHDIPLIKEVNTVSKSSIVYHEDYDNLFSPLVDPSGFDSVKSMLFVHFYLNSERGVEFLRDDKFYLKTGFGRVDYLQYLKNHIFESLNYNMIHIIPGHTLDELFRQFPFVISYSDHFLPKGKHVLLLKCARDGVVMHLDVNRKIDLLFMGNAFMITNFLGVNVFIDPYKYKRQFHVRSLRTRIILGMGKHHDSTTMVSSRNGSLDEKHFGHGNMSALSKYVWMVYSGNAVNIEFLSVVDDSVNLSSKFESISTMDGQEETERKYSRKEVTMVLLWVEKFCCTGIGYGDSSCEGGDGFFRGHEVALAG